MNDNGQEQPISKTQLKKHMDKLQQLGIQLTTLPDDALKKIGLSESLYQAVLGYKKITSHSALKRQAQYISRLMRDNDSEHIEHYLNRLHTNHAARNAFLQYLEQTRSRLIKNDHALTDFITRYPHADAGRLRTLIRNTRKEQQQNKPPKNFRALFQEIKAVAESPSTTQ